MREHFSLCTQSHYLLSCEKIHMVDQVIARMLWRNISYVWMADYLFAHHVHVCIIPLLCVWQHTCMPPTSDTHTTQWHVLCLTVCCIVVSHRQKLCPSDVSHVLSPIRGVWKRVTSSPKPQLWQDLYLMHRREGLECSWVSMMIQLPTSARSWRKNVWLSSWESKHSRYIVDHSLSSQTTVLLYGLTY